MATANAPAVSMLGSGGGSWLSDFGRSVGGIVRDLRPIWDRDGTTGQTNASQGQPTQQTTNNTTGTTIGTADTMTKYLPWLVIGGSVLAIVLIARK